MYLTGLIFLPLFFLIPLVSVKKPVQVKLLGFIFSIVHFIYSLALLFKFDQTATGFQLEEKATLVQSLGIHYALGIDGISLWLVLLTTFLLPLVFLGCWNSLNTRPRTYVTCLFLLQISMLGTFLSTDLILFYLFFESSLIPMFLMIGIWGGKQKIYATVKFFLYTMFGSIFMLGSIITMMILNFNVAGSYSSLLVDLSQLNVSFVEGSLFSTQTLLFFGFALAFAVKTPLFPVHTWLPDAHVQAPTPGSVVLAGVMLKMGTYGFLRFCFDLFPEASVSYAWFFCMLAVFGIVYGALVALVQTDIKKLVAYSSVSHMGYVVLGLFCLNELGQVGSLYQMLNHGISTGALFLLVGMIYERTHNREISFYGGLASKMPLFTIFFMIVTFSSIAVPLTNGFVGEFLILLGAFQTSPALGIGATLGVVLGASYMLWMVKRVFFGPQSEKVKEMTLPDLTWKEIACLTPLVILIFWMGLFPMHFLDKTKSSLDKTAQKIESRIRYVSEVEQ